MDQPRFVPLDFREFPPDEMESRARAFYEEDMRRRGSVRHFSDRPVLRSVVEWAVRAAGTAPSGAHKQPWKFVLVGDAGRKTAIREGAEAEERENDERRMPAEWLADLAPLGTDWPKPFLTTCPWAARRLRGGPREDGGGKGEARLRDRIGRDRDRDPPRRAPPRGARDAHPHAEPDGFPPPRSRRPDHERAFLRIALGFPAEGGRVPVLDRKPLDDILVTVGSPP